MNMDMDIDLDINIDENKIEQKKTHRRRKTKNRELNLGENMELCGYGEEKHNVGGILEVEETEISKSGMPDTLLNVDSTVLSPIQNHMDTSRNLVEDSTEPKKIYGSRKSKSRKPNLGENMELSGYREEKHTGAGVLEVKEMEISKSAEQDTFLNVDLTTQSPIQKHMETAGNLVEGNTGPKRPHRRKKLRSRKPNLVENMELCGHGEEKHTVGGVFEVEEMEISKSGLQETFLHVDLTTQSPIQKHMETAGDLVEGNTEPKRPRRRGKSRNRKPILGENMELCVYGEEKRTGSGISEVKEMEISKCVVQDALVQSPIEKHMDTAGDLVEENAEQKKTCRRKKSKKRKQNIGENMELCGYGEEKQTVGGIVEVEGMDISKSGVQDTLPNVDLSHLTMQSLIQKHMDATSNLVEENTVLSKQTVGGILEAEKMEISKSGVRDTHIVALIVQTLIQEHVDSAGKLTEGLVQKNKKRRPKAQYKDNLQILDQTEVVAPLSLSDKPQVVGGDKPQVLSLSDKPQALSLSDKPQALSLSDKSQVVGGDKPQALSLSDKPQVVGGDKPQALSLSDKPQVVGGDKPQALSLSDKPQVVGGDKPHALSLSNKPQVVGGDKPQALSLSDKPQVVGGDEPQALSLSDKPQLMGGDEPQALSLSDKPQLMGGDEPQASSLFDKPQVVGGDKPHALSLSDKPQLMGGDEPQALSLSDKPQAVGGDKPQALSLSDKPQVVGGDDDDLNNVQGAIQEFQVSSREKSGLRDNNEERFCNDPVAVVGKVNALLKILYPAPKRTPVARLRRKLLILDVNGLLGDVVKPAPQTHEADAYIFKRAIFRRPFCCDFLRFCFERFDVGIWSSRSNKILDEVVNYLLGDMKHNLVLFWNMSHCTVTKFKTIENRHKLIVFKELRKIWEKSFPNLPWKKGYYDESNTLLLDDSPYKALLNPVHTGIFPLSYSFQNQHDNSLGPRGDLRVYLEGLANADNCKEYVKKHPFGQRGIDESNPDWAFYSKVLESRPNLLRKYTSEASHRL